jgi:Raf kinase inhibitor-like YbhB/YbcL family protein
VAVLFSKVLITKNKSVDFKNINEQKHMKIESDIFSNNGKIPALYTCDGKGTQVPLKISNVPEEAKNLALIVDDPDAPNGDFVHWIIWNIDPKIFIIENGSIPLGAIEGYTSLNKPGWVAPCPPSGIHHYNFKLYALDVMFSISEFSDKKALLHAMDGHIIENATLVGLYERDKIQ